MWKYLIALLLLPMTAHAYEKWSYGHFEKNSRFDRGSNTITVISDPGGKLTDRENEIQEIIARGISVKIKGTCNSACTMYLGLPDVCVYPNANLGFHGPSSLKGKTFTREKFDAYSERVAAWYNPSLKKWFMDKSRFRTGDEYYRLPGSELIRLGYRPC